MSFPGISFETLPPRTQEILLLLDPSYRCFVTVKQIRMVMEMRDMSVPEIAAAIARSLQEAVDKKKAEELAMQVEHEAKLVQGKEKEEAEKGAADEQPPKSDEELHAVKRRRTRQDDDAEAQTSCLLEQSDSRREISAKEAEEMSAMRQELKAFESSLSFATDHLQMNQRSHLSFNRLANAINRHRSAPQEIVFRSSKVHFTATFESCLLASVELLPTQHSVWKALADCALNEYRSHARVGDDDDAEALKSTVVSRHVKALETAFTTNKSSNANVKLDEVGSIQAMIEVMTEFKLTEVTLRVTETTELWSIFMLWLRWVGNAPCQWSVWLLVVLHMKRTRIFEVTIPILCEVKTYRTILLMIAGRVQSADVWAELGDELMDSGAGSASEASVFDDHAGRTVQVRPADCYLRALALTASKKNSNPAEHLCSRHSLQGRCLYRLAIVAHWEEVFTLSPNRDDGENHDDQQQEALSAIGLLTRAVAILLHAPDKDDSVFQQCLLQIAIIIQRSNSSIDLPSLAQPDHVAHHDDRHHQHHHHHQHHRHHHHEHHSYTAQNLFDLVKDPKLREKHFLGAESSPIPPYVSFFDHDRFEAFYALRRASAAAEQFAREQMKQLFDFGRSCYRRRLVEEHMECSASIALDADINHIKRNHNIEVRKLFAPAFADVVKLATTEKRNMELTMLLETASTLVEPLYNKAVEHTRQQYISGFNASVDAFFMRVAQAADRNADNANRRIKANECEQWRELMRSHATDKNIVALFLTTHGSRATNQVYVTATAKQVYLTKCDFFVCKSNGRVLAVNNRLPVLLKRLLETQLWCVAFDGKSFSFEFLPSKNVFPCIFTAVGLQPLQAQDVALPQIVLQYIARQQSMETDVLLCANPSISSASQRVPPGYQIVMPPRQQEQSAVDVAQLYNVSIQEFLAVNPKILKPTDVVLPSQRVCIPSTSISQILLSNDLWRKVDGKYVCVQNTAVQALDLEELEDIWAVPISLRQVRDQHRIAYYFDRTDDSYVGLDHRAPADFANRIARRLPCYLPPPYNTVQFQNVLSGSTTFDLVSSHAVKWVPVESAEGRYYLNQDTEETTWNRPAELDEAEEIAAALELVASTTVPAGSGGWNVIESTEGKYYHNPTTGEVTWDMPEELQAKPAGKWVPVESPEGVYYYNTETEEMTGDRPADLEEVVVTVEEQPLASVSAWNVIESTEGTYYHNPTTGESTWDIPMELLWESVESPEGVYYCNTQTQETKWERPAELGEPKKSS